MSARKIFDLKDDERTLQLYGDEAGDPEIYIDGAWGFMATHGICKVTTYTIAPTEEPNFERREVAVRLTMTLPVLFALRDFLNMQCKKIEDTAQDIEAAAEKDSTEAEKKET